MDKSWLQNSQKWIHHDLVKTKKDPTVQMPWQNCQKYQNSKALVMDESKNILLLEQNFVLQN